MADVLIKDSELQELNNLILDIPTRHGVPLLNFFTKVVNTRQQEFAKANANTLKEKSQSTPGPAAQVQTEGQP